MQHSLTNSLTNVCRKLHEMGFHGRAATNHSKITLRNAKRQLELCTCTHTFVVYVVNFYVSYSVIYCSSNHSPKLSEAKVKSRLEWLLLLLSVLGFTLTFSNYCKYEPPIFSKTQHSGGRIFVQVTKHAVTALLVCRAGDDTCMKEWPAVCITHISWAIWPIKCYFKIRWFCNDNQNKINPL